MAIFRLSSRVGSTEGSCTAPTVLADLDAAWIKPAFTAAVMCVAMLGLTWPARHVYMRGHNDFLAFYAGAKLAFTDVLYDPPTVAAVQEAHSGTAGPALRFIRLPFYAVALSPLALLSYSSAYVLWQSLNVICVVGAVLLWPHNRVLFAQVSSVYVPLYWSFLNGQDIGLLLLLLVLAMRSMSACSLVACLIKFHFLWLTPVAIPRRTWIQTVATAALLLALPLIWYPAWPAAYYRTVVRGRSVISHVPVSVFSYLGWVGLFVAAIAALIIAERCSREIAFSSAIALAVVVSPHAYVQDYSLAIPFIALMWQRVRSRKGSRLGNSRDDEAEAAPTSKCFLNSASTLGDHPKPAISYHLKTGH